MEAIGGLDTIIQDLRRTMDLALGVVEQNAFTKTSRAVLVHGLARSGKTMLCEGLARSYENAHVINIDSWKIFSKFSGEYEMNLKKCFDEAFLVYPKPSIIIIDELSNLCPKNDSTDLMRKVSTLLAQLIDSLHSKRNASKVFFLAHTSNLDNVDPAIRRSG